MARKTNRAGASDERPDLDREHLARYTMENADLEREIIGLFLGQLPSVIKMLREAQTRSDWKMAAHTLKGSAAAVGAAAIRDSALALESYIFDVDAKIRISLVTELDRVVARFAALAQQIYGDF